MNPNVCSQVGACGLAQIMPKTWMDLSKAMKYGQGASPFEAGKAAEAGAYMMGKLRYQWRRDRQALQSHALAAASYNRGIGNIISDQRECSGARLWPQISPCTLTHTREPVDYVARIWRYWQEMER